MPRGIRRWRGCAQRDSQVEGLCPEGFTGGGAVPRGIHRWRGVHEGDPYKSSLPVPRGIHKSRGWWGCGERDSEGVGLEVL